MMTPQPFLLLSSLIITSLPLTGCLGTYEEQTEESANTSSQRALTGNSLSTNGLSANGLSANGLSANGLSANGLSANGLVMNALQDPQTSAAAREFLSYVVSCALGPNTTIQLPLDDTLVDFPGGLGLAPDWGQANASCDRRCQEIVSACVMARVNAQGHHIPLSMRGLDSSSPALGSSSAERAEYPKEEATYFGNLFVSPQALYACKSTSHPNLISRPCGPEGGQDACVIRILGSCDQVLFGAASPICAVQDPSAGYRFGCRDEQKRPWDNAITIFRKNIDDDNPTGAD
jgi:hypothetical protein